MVDFNIKHYLVDEPEPYDVDERTAKLRAIFYGDIKEKPETEQQLFKLQEQYLKTRDTKIWSEMFGICWSYMQSLIKKRIKKGSKFNNKSFLEKDELDDKTTAATLTFMSSYLTRPEFEVGASFAGMMNWTIIGVMYGYTQDDKTMSLSLETHDDGKVTLADTISNSLSTEPYKNPEDDALSVDYCELISELFDELDDVIDDYKLSIIARAYVLICLKHPKNRHVKNMFVSKWAPTYKEEKLLEYVMLEVYNRLKDSGNIA